MSMTTMALIAWIAGSLMAILFAFVTPGQGWVAFDRIVQVLSTVGTVGAVVVALVTTHNANRRQERANLERARLVAAGLSQRLYPALIDLKLAVDEIRSVEFDPLRNYSFDQNLAIDERMKTARALASNAVQNSVFETDVVLAHDLTPLANDAAVKFYEGIASIQAAVDVGWCEGAKEIWASPVLYHRFANLQEVGSLLDVAFNKLTESRAEMFNSAQKYPKFPQKT